MNTEDYTLREDVLVIAVFAGTLIKDESLIREKVASYLSGAATRRVSCPFRGRECVKVRGRPVGSKPLPICSVRLKNGDYIAICHERVANEAVVTALVEEAGLAVRRVFKNVKLPSGRSYDFLLVADDKGAGGSSPVFVFVEVITVDTTNTGSLLKMLLQRRQEHRYRHNLSINWENVRKREVIQMLYKDRIVREAARKSYSVNLCYIGLIQRQTFDRLFGGEYQPYQPLGEFCEGYLRVTNSIGFLLFLMVEDGQGLSVRLDSGKVAIVDFERLIGIRASVVERDVEGLLRRLRGAEAGLGSNDAWNREAGAGV